MDADVQQSPEEEKILIAYFTWAENNYLEENDLSGKKVVLFCSHGTGGLASSVQDLSAVLQGSEVEGNVIGVYRDEVSSSQDTIKEWLRESGY